ncbi:MAG: glycosyltransferase [Planctomycetota bacterium]|nr:glycosyltransferase [Planctomycetota bacterium]
MRVLLVNWARLPDGPLDGGGVNGYCQQLALELVGRGHEVAYLSSGVTYTRRGNGTGPCEVRRLDDFRGVRVFDVVNSPVIAPGPCQARRPEAEIASPELERELARFVGLLAPDVVHFQNIEGLSAASVDAMRRAVGAGCVVFSLHNYHTVCPQVYLMQRGRVPCRNFRGGQACVGCADVCDPAEERLIRAGVRERHAPAPAPEPAKPRRAWGVFIPPPEPVAQPLPGRPTAVLADVDAAIAPAPHLAPAAEPPLPGEREPLDNTPTPDPWDPGTENVYGARRRAMVGALASCDAVLGVSPFVRAKFEALGVPGGVLRTMPIGTRMGDLARAAGLHAGGEVRPRRPGPVRLAFLGYHNFYKGLHCLVDALERCDAGVLGEIDLLVSAKAVEPIEPALRRLRARLARLSVEHGYRYDEIPDLLRDREVGVVPSVWWDNGPQTVLEFQACGLAVVGAAVGGVPDMVRDGVDALLFRGNDAGALAAALARLGREPGLVDRLRGGVRPPKGMGEHAAELERLYAELLRARRRG